LRRLTIDVGVLLISLASIVVLVVAVVGGITIPRREIMGREFSGVEHQSAVCGVVEIIQILRRRRNADVLHA